MNQGMPGAGEFRGDPSPEKVKGRSWRKKPLSYDFKKKNRDAVVRRELGLKEVESSWQSELLACLQPTG